MENGHAFLWSGRQSARAPEREGARARGREGAASTRHGCYRGRRLSDPGVQNSARIDGKAQGGFLVPAELPAPNVNRLSQVRLLCGLRVRDSCGSQAVSSRSRPPRVHYQLTNCNRRQQRTALHCQPGRAKSHQTVIHIKTPPSPPR